MSCNKTCNHYRKGDNLFTEGSYPDGIFCINRGAIKVYKTGVDGKDQIIFFAQPGDFLGYPSLISEQPYTASATAMQDVIACFIPKYHFLNLLEGNPRLNREMMKSLCNELAIERNRLMNMAQKSVRERLAETLLILLETFRDAQADPELIDIALPREDIANLVGTATESIIRLLSSFKKEGLIETQGKKIRIKKERELYHIAKTQHPIKTTLAAG